MADVKEKCGVAAVYLPKPLDKYPVGGAAFYLYKMLLQMQNRGQLSAGITTYNKDREQLLDTYKKLGTVNEVFWTRVPEKSAGVFSKYAGNKGIGHVRYATCGSELEALAQPFERHHGRIWKWFSFAFNGNIANFAELRNQLKKSHYHLVHNTDTEMILQYIAKGFIGEKKPSLVDVFSKLGEKFDGAYSLVFINGEGTIIALRDPYGFRPLCYSSDDKFTGVASESVSLTNLSSEFVNFIEPGKMLIIRDGHTEIKRFAKCKRKAHCMFEWVYFANASSILDGKSVYRTRWRLGEELAKSEPLKTDHDYIVVGVPDTAKPAADALAHSLGIPSMEGLIRNRYVGRTFIEGNNRAERAREKYTIVKSVLKGKKVLLVEDSIVRGTTGRALVNYIREKGKPKEIHVRVSCPPIRAPCFYGIDMSTLGELIAPRHMSKEEIRTTGMHDLDEKTVEKIRKEIGADSLVYQSLRGLVNAIRFNSGAKDLCMACLTGEYPTPYGKRLYKKAKSNSEKGINKRTYE